MYVEQTSENTIAIKDLSMHEAHILLFLINEGGAKINNNEHFVHEKQIADEMYKKIDREIILSRSIGGRSVDHGRGF